MGSALLDTLPGSAPERAAANTDAAARISAGEALRQQAAERLAAHRSRRAGVKPLHDAVQQAAVTGNARASQIAAAVAERYAKQQSYHAFLAAEAERAVQQARAAAEVAVLQAQAMEAAQQSLLDSLELSALEAEEVSATPPESHAQQAPLIPDERSLWADGEGPGHRDPHSATRSQRVDVTQRWQPAAEPEPVPVTAQHAPASPFAVRMEHEVTLPELRRESLQENRRFDRYATENNGADALALDEEIAFRQAPVFEDFHSRPEPLPANLIEFPRQLIASRKARPRIAEGPLREEVADRADGQLRIFEVETAQISTEAVSEDAGTPQWTSIFLDAQQHGPAAAAEPVTAPSTAGLPGIASVERRIVAAAINGCIIGVALAAFGGAAMITSGNAAGLHSLSLGSMVNMLRSPDGRAVLEAGAAVALLLCFAYQALFFTFASATPGMRCARIALCTFTEENPTRKAMRRRILAVLLSGIPFGLGFLWATLDEEKLSWHDRVSGMYQRMY